MADLEVSDNTPAGDDERRKALLQGIALPNPFSQAGLPGVTPATVTNPTKAAAIYAAPPVTTGQSSSTYTPPAPAATPMSGLPPVATPEDKRLSTAQQTLSDLQAKPSLEQRTSDWGARHGSIGKIGGGILRGIETAGEVVAPGIAAAIPGTQINLGMQRKAAQGEVAQAEKGVQEQAQTAHTKAETAKTQAETENVGTPKSEAEGKTITTDEGIFQWNPDTHRYDVRVGDAPEKATAGTKTVTTDEGIFQWNPDTKRYDIPVGGAPEKLNEKEKDVADIIAEKGWPNDAAHREQAREIIAKRNKTVVEPGNYTPVTDAKGATIGWVDPKSGHFKPTTSIPGLSQAVGGSAIPAKPTQQMRNVGAQAQVAVEGIPGVLQEIDGMKGDLGPIMGRWNEFMQGKVGMEDPRFAGLRADLLMLSSAVALAHARGRLPENLREEFDKALNAPRQSPENLKATIQHVQTWMQRMTTIGQGEGTTGGTTRFTDGGKSYNIPNDQVEAFKRDHPNAR